MADIKILYEDNHLLALDKPAGLLTQPSGRQEDSLEARAKTWIKQVKDKPGEVFLHAVHRLDRQVSGVVLFALTGKALSRMNEQMREKAVLKIYHALITSEPAAASGILLHHLRHSRLRSVTASPHEKGSKPSRLSYRVVTHLKGMYLVEIVLETGRYHQIRAQLAELGCPVLGDVRYGGERWPDTYGIALHHRRMEFMHPTLKSQIIIVASYPENWPVFATSSKEVK
ncbi:MAG TPA: RNA pseudouridine synthase [Desulfomonilia bacterium]|nr:RNA pseudouridine synthase [Desulfomonilia bacterium]